MQNLQQTRSLELPDPVTFQEVVLRLTSRKWERFCCFLWSILNSTIFSYPYRILSTEKTATSREESGPLCSRMVLLPRTVVKRTSPGTTTLVTVSVDIRTSTTGPYLIYRMRDAPWESGEKLAPYFLQARLSCTYVCFDRTKGYSESTRLKTCKTPTFWATARACLELNSYTGTVPKVVAIFLKRTKSTKFFSLKKKNLVQQSNFPQSLADSSNHNSIQQVQRFDPRLRGLGWGRLAAQQAEWQRSSGG